MKTSPERARAIAKTVARYVNLVSRTTDPGARNTAWHDVMDVTSDDGEVFAALWTVGRTTILLLDRHSHEYIPGLHDAAGQPVDPSEVSPAVTAGVMFLDSCAAEDYETAMAVFEILPEAREPIEEFTAWLLNTTADLLYTSIRSIGAARIVDQVMGQVEPS